MDTLHEDQCTVHLRQCLAEFFLKFYMFHRKIVEKIKEHILCPAAFSPKILPFMR